MAINKVIYGGTTLIDLSGDSLASADQLMQGVTAHDRTGALITGTATGGGGTSGLEYEEGTWSPSEDINRPTINFTNTHSEAPAYISISDVSDNSTIPTYSNVGWTYIDIEKLTGSSFPYSTTVVRYGYYVTVYRQTSNVVSYSYMFYYSSNTQGSSSSGYPRYWATESWFKPYTNSLSRYWYANRTYKWIAVWAPTT